MDKHILPKFLIITVAISCIICPVVSAFAKDAVIDSQAKEDPYTLQSQARGYREKGLNYQNLGNLSEAKSLYQKAITLDPNYAVAYNDLGVIYEAEGALDKAEASYLRAIKIDPDYSSAYTNLAFLYENKRDLETAEFYWTKRVELGFPDDPWTQKATSRLNDIRLSLNGRSFADQGEEEVLGLMKEVTADKDKSVFNKDDKELAGDYFQKAKQSFNKGDFTMAIKRALDAHQLDKNNKEIEAFIEEAERKALSR